MASERRTELVRYNDVQIEVVIDGRGPAVVLLPSLARDSDDYDEVAEGPAAWVEYPDRLPAWKVPAHRH